MMKSMRSGVVKSTNGFNASISLVIEKAFSRFSVSPFVGVAGAVDDST